MTIALFEPQVEKDWDDYVLKHEGGTFFHQIGWKKAIERAYGLKSYYLLAKDGDKIIGVLPLFAVKHIAHGRCLVSLPFGPYGGVCADNDKVKRALINAAAEITRTEKARYLELRQWNNSVSDLPLNNHYVTLILQLEEDSEKLWKNFKSEIRNRVRKAIKSGLEFHIGDREDLKDFYAVYLENMRDLGTPAHSFAFIQAVMDEFPSQIKIFLVRHAEKTIGGMFVILFKSAAINMWASSLKSYLQYSPNNLLYWGVIKFASENGYKYFDFGRSAWNSGTFIFKQRWGAQPKQLYYQYFLNKVNSIPDSAGSDKGQGLMVGLWKKLPLSVTKRLGPVIRKNIP